MPLVSISSKEYLRCFHYELREKGRGEEKLKRGTQLYVLSNLTAGNLRAPWKSPELNVFE